MEDTVVRFEKERDKREMRNRGDRDWRKKEERKREFSDKRKKRERIFKNK